MIVRIISEGQYQVDSALLDELNAVDAQIVTAVGQGDEPRFRALLAQLLRLVRERGQPVPADELVASDVVLPEPDTTFEEAKSLFVGEGAIPG
jgi:hypothetical protein